MKAVEVSREVYTSLRRRFGNQLLQEQPRTVIAPASLQAVKDAVEMARHEHLKLLPLGTGSSFPSDFSRLHIRTLTLLLGTLKGECGGDTFSSWYWAGTRLSQLSADYPGFFNGESQRTTLGGLIADGTLSSLDVTRRLVQRLMLSMEIFTAAGNIETFVGGGTGTVYQLPASSLFFGSQGRLGIILRVNLRRIVPPKFNIPLSNESERIPMTGNSNHALSWNQKLELLDPGGLFAWESDR